MRPPSTTFDDLPRCSIVLGGEWDVANVAALTQTLIGAIRCGGDVLVDLTATRFIDLMALRALEQLVAALEEADRRLSIVGVDRGVARLIDLVGTRALRARCSPPRPHAISA
jgi:anti-anti-sigma factor